MPKWKTSFLIALLAVAGLAQTATDLETPAVNRVAEKMHCNCGCNLNMACQMPPYPCPVCRAAKIKILDMQKAGMNDDQILSRFVAEQGKDVLVIPPGTAGVVGPYIALAIGLGLVIWTIRRYMGRKPAAAGGPEIDNSTLAEIENELARLDSNEDSKPPRGGKPA